MDIKDIHDDFERFTLDKFQLNMDPVMQFRQWLEDALESDPKFATVMNLSTVSKEGMPSSRIVLLKGIDATGFRFFTSYESRKGKDIRANSNGAILFFWKELERQVRIEGSIEKISYDKSVQYFRDRPMQSQISAFISPQSHEVPSREFLEDEFHKAWLQYKDDEVPMPSNWGGYVLKPKNFEFWQGRPGRLHDRFVYELNETGAWNISRLAP
jgi:pyridoxamine-phosphate oxidase